MPLVRRRTAPAPAVRRHYDTSEPARWRAAATPAVRHPTTPQRRLKIFSQATTRVPLRRHDVGSRFPLKMEPGADGCDSGKMTVAFSLAWLKPPRCCSRQASTSATRYGGPVSAPGEKPANDRPSPRSVLVHTSTLSPAAPGRKASSCRSRGRAAGARWRPAAAVGLFHSRPKNLSHAT